MLNNKVEHCPNCGKIKSKFRACKACGFGESGDYDIAPMPATDTLVPRTFKYFATYSYKVDDSMILGNLVVHSGISTISTALIQEIEEVIEEKYKATNVIIINIIKLEY